MSRCRLVPVSVRLEGSALALLEAIRLRMQARLPEMRVSRSAAVRAALDAVAVEDVCASEPSLGAAPGGVYGGGAVNG